MIFPHPDLIPKKFRHEFSPLQGKWRLSILHGDGENCKGVDILVTREDLKLPRKKFNARFMRPALSLLEDAINPGAFEAKLAEAKAALEQGAVT